MEERQNWVRFCAHVELTMKVITQQLFPQKLYFSENLVILNYLY